MSGMVVGPVEMRESPAAFWRDFPKQLVEIRAFCGFPQMRHFHQARLFCGSIYPQILLKTRKFEDLVSRRKARHGIIRGYAQGTPNSSARVREGLANGERVGNQFGIGGKLSAWLYCPCFHPHSKSL